MRKSLEYYIEHLDDLQMRNSVDEQETVILMERRNDQTVITTSDRVFFTKLRKLIHTGNYTIVDVTSACDAVDDNEITSITCTAPKKMVSLRKTMKTASGLLKGFGKKNFDDDSIEDIDSEDIKEDD